MPVASCGLPVHVDEAFDSAEQQDALILIAAFEAMRYGTPTVLKSFAQGPSAPASHCRWGHRIRPMAHGDRQGCSTDDAS